MTLDHLLIWLSARASGSWYQFRAAVEELNCAATGNDSDSDALAPSAFPPHQTVRLNLQRLGHAEFSFSPENMTWRVVPPTVAVRETRSRSIGILCGARAPDLTSRLEELPNDVTWDSLRRTDMPQRLRLIAETPQAIERAAQSLDFHIQPSAPESLLAAIPPIDDPRSRGKASAPTTPGWTIERFVPSSLRWTTQHWGSDRDLEYLDFERAHTDLFRFRMKHQRFYFLRWRSGTFKVPVQVGKYVVLRSRRVRGILQYDRASSLLSVPVTCRPPLLIERALVLCSGCLPTLDNGTRRLVYSVPWKVARLSATLLRQETILQ